MSLWSKQAQSRWCCRGVTACGGSWLGGCCSRGASWVDLGRQYERVRWVTWMVQVGMCMVQVGDGSSQLYFQCPVEEHYDLHEAPHM